MKILRTLLLWLLIAAPVLAQVHGDQVWMGQGNLSGTTLPPTGYVYASQYGVVADVQTTPGGFCTAGSTTLTTSAGLFAPLDIGKRLFVEGCGIEGTTHKTFIAAVVSPSQVTMADPAVTSTATTVVAPIETQVVPGDPSIDSLPQTVILNHQQVIVSTVVVRDSTLAITYVTPDDYIVSDPTGGAITIPVTSSITVGQTLKINYSYNQSSVTWGTWSAANWVSFANAACNANGGILPPGEMLIADNEMWPNSPRVNEWHTLTAAPLPQTMQLAPLIIPTATLTVKSFDLGVTYATPNDYVLSDPTSGVLTFPATSTIAPGQTIRISYSNSTCTKNTSLIGENTIVDLGGDGLHGTACNPFNRDGAMFSFEPNQSYWRVKQFVVINNNGPGGSPVSGPAYAPTNDEGCALRIARPTNQNQAYNSIDIKSITPRGLSSQPRTTGRVNPDAVFMGSTVTRLPLRIGQMGPSPGGAHGGFCKPFVSVANQHAYFDFGVLVRPDWDRQNHIYCDANAAMRVGGFDVTVRMDCDSHANCVDFSGQGGFQELTVLGGIGGDSYFTQMGSFGGTLLFDPNQTTYVAGFPVIPSTTVLITGPCAATTNTCVVADGTQFNVKDPVGIGTNAPHGPGVEKNVITAINGNTLTFFNTLGFTHAGPENVRKSAYAGHYYVNHDPCTSGAAPAWSTAFQGVATDGGGCVWHEMGPGYAIKNDSSNVVGSVANQLNVLGFDGTATGLGCVLSTSPDPTTIVGETCFRQRLVDNQCLGCSHMHIIGGTSNQSFAGYLNAVNATDVSIRGGSFYNSGNPVCWATFNNVSRADYDPAINPCLLGLNTPPTGLSPNFAIDIATVGATKTVDWVNNVAAQYTTTTATNLTISMLAPPVAAFSASPPAAAQMTRRQLMLCEPAAGTLTHVTWPVSCDVSDVAGCIDWQSAAVPDLTQTLGRGDLFWFSYDATNAKYIGSQLANLKCPP